MTINEFIKSLELPNVILNNIIVNENNSVKYDLNDSDTFSKVYSRLDKNDSIDLDIDSMIIDGTKTHLVYLGDDFDVILDSDFDTDEYVLLVKRAEE